jgi:hypothetical protein
MDVFLLKLHTLHKTLSEILVRISTVCVLLSATVTSVYHFQYAIQSGKPKSVNLKHSLVLTGVFRFETVDTGMCLLDMLFLQLLHFHAGGCTSYIVT